MAKSTGPIAKVENKSGSVSTKVTVPANVSTPSAPGSNLASPLGQRASSGRRITDAGLGFQKDSRMCTDGVNLTTGYTSKSIADHGALRTGYPAKASDTGPNKGN